MTNGAIDRRLRAALQVSYIDNFNFDAVSTLLDDTIPVRQRYLIHPSEEEKDEMLVILPTDLLLSLVAYIKYVLDPDIKKDAFFITFIKEITDFGSMEIRILFLTYIYLLQDPRLDTHPVVLRLLNKPPSNQRLN